MPAKTSSTSSTPIPPAPDHCPPGYTVHWSKSQKMHFFFESITGDKVWACDYDHTNRRFKVSKADRQKPSRRSTITADERMDTSYVEETGADHVTTSHNAEQATTSQSADEPMDIDDIMQEITICRHSVDGRFVINASETTASSPTVVDFTPHIRHPTAHVLQYLIVDTNVFIDSLPMIRSMVDGSADLAFVQLIIVVPLIVFDELDKLSHGRRTDIAQRAIEARRFVNMYVHENSSSTMGSKLILQSIAHATFDHSWPLLSNDDHVTKCAVVARMYCTNAQMPISVNGDTRMSIVTSDVTMHTKVRNESNYGQPLECVQIVKPQMCRSFTQPTVEAVVAQPIVPVPSIMHQLSSPSTADTSFESLAPPMVVVDPPMAIDEKKAAEKTKVVDSHEVDEQFRKLLSRADRCVMLFLQRHANVHYWPTGTTGSHSAWQTMLEYDRAIPSSIADALHYVLRYWAEIYSSWWVCDDIAKEKDVLKRVVEELNDANLTRRQSSRIITEKVLVPLSASVEEYAKIAGSIVADMRRLLDDGCC